MVSSSAGAHATKPPKPLRFRRRHQELRLQQTALGAALSEHRPLRYELLPLKNPNPLGPFREGFYEGIKTLVERGELDEVAKTRQTEG